ncbi:6,7-dimethyl-8-ribityllumazine synthase [Oleiharenicola sp. Vm1]|uniref:6,7-dimethyl-8-ribityllumazine synthase n=1 Tax=Oleiharenicola sp. Vm1 TaxID=3398393 RepID=UPI0039F61608
MSLHAPSDLNLRGAGLRFGLVAARFNAELVDGLRQRARAVLAAAGVRAADIVEVRVPGSHEVPWAAQQLAAAKRFDCVIALGVLIGGDTNHHEMVGDSVSHALQQVALGTGVPVINGVIVANTPAQARVRCLGRIDRGAEFARAGLEMATLRRTLRKGQKS